MVLMVATNRFPRNIFCNGDRVVQSLDYITIIENGKLDNSYDLLLPLFIQHWALMKVHRTQSHRAARRVHGW